MFDLFILLAPIAVQFLSSHFLFQVSNIIYLDSPVGVGLSYSKNQSDYVTGDLQTATDTHAFLLKVRRNRNVITNLAHYCLRALFAVILKSKVSAVQQWFQLYSEFLSNPFFIAGESYAGVYVPTLSYEVVKGISS